MKRIHSLNDALLAGQLRNLLQSRDITCELRNLELRTGMGEIPLAECWIELWIGDDAREDEALELIRGTAAPPEGTAPWTCPDCGETLEGQFDACWQCGGAAPGQAS